MSIGGEGRQTGEDPTSAVEVLFLNVGQGDATLAVDLGTRQALLIDCPSGREYVVEEALAHRSALLHTAIVTHWDFDHYGGVLNVLSRGDCQNFYYNHDCLIAEGRNARVKATLRRLRSPLYRDIDFGSAERDRSGRLGNLTYRLLAPTHRQLTDAVAAGDKNLGSAVVLLQAHGSRVLVGGDADGRVWRTVLSRPESIEAPVLRWPHHGAMRHQEATTDAGLLAAVQPELVVLSAGTNNSYKHPLPSTLDAVVARSTEVMCTQVTGKCHSALPSDEVPCAGSVSLVLAPNGIRQIDPSGERHRATVDKWDRPLCRMPAPHYIGKGFKARTPT